MVTWRSPSNNRLSTQAEREMADDSQEPSKEDAVKGQLSFQQLPYIIVVERHIRLINWTIIKFTQTRTYRALRRNF